MFRVGISGFNGDIIEVSYNLFYGYRESNSWNILPITAPEGAGGSSIVIENMNTFSQMVTYLYRPIPFEAHNLTSFFSSIDNVILIILTISSSFLIFNKKIQGPSYIFLISIFVCNLFILSKTTANLGIAVRQKWMILPVLIILLLSLYSQKSNDEKN